MTSETKTPKLETSAEIVASIDDLLMQIHLCLPTKSLVRFRLVSKHWESLITSPQFFLLRNPRPTAVGLFFPVRKRCGFKYVHFNPKSPINTSFRELKFPGEASNLFWVTQSCNGLLVCCGTQGFTYKGGKFAVKKCYIYNPTTNQFRNIPTPNDDNFKGVHGVFLAFDPLKSPNFKAVAVSWGDMNSKSYQIQIYSSESRSWVMSGKHFHAGVHIDYAVYWNDSINWISYITGKVFYFNVSQERMGWVPSPTGGWKYRQLEYFGVSRGNLHLVESNRKIGAVVVHEMKSDHSEWMVKYRVDLSFLYRAYPKMVYLDMRRLVHMYEFSIYSFVRGEQAEGLFLILQICKKVLRFNIMNSTFEEIFDFEGVLVDDWYKFEGPLAFEHIESLAFV